jgi:hypothetical protein
MKVLVDSCVWSLSIRRRNGFASLNKDEQPLVLRLVEGIKDGRVVMVWAGAAGGSVGHQA